jgi:hypothetical protein
MKYSNNDFCSVVDKPESDQFFDQDLPSPVYRYTKEESAMANRRQRIEQLKKLLTGDKAKKFDGGIPVVNIGFENPRLNVQYNADSEYRTTSAVNSLTRHQATFVGLLVESDCDPRAQETPLNAFGQTALGLTCDPDFWLKLNKSEMEILHDADRLCDLLYAGCNWDAKDKRGKSPRETCPEWLKEVFESLEPHVRKRNGTR